MKKHPLANTNFEISEICLGTMTWGKQNNQNQAFEQMDYAIDQGINFFDTAEMYAIPAVAETYGTTETIIGNWLQKTGQRDNIILASKATGPGEWMRHIRGGPRLNKSHLEEAIEGSLKRLKTDVIDIYQMHWPDRNTNFFGQLGYKHYSKEQTTPIAETVAALGELIQKGKIKHWGLSNETPWGVMRFLAEADQQGVARPISIQNPYSLLNRSYEVGLAEISHRENIGLLAYSPLAFGVLSGKYLSTPLNSANNLNRRLDLFKQFSRYTNPQATMATEKYCALAAENNLSPTQMALAYVTNQPFVSSNIIGATTMEQLKENIGSAQITISKELNKAINKIHAEHTYPAP